MALKKTRKTDAEFAVELELWLEALLMLYNDHVLAVSAHAARLWGRLSAKLGKWEA